MQERPAVRSAVGLRLMNALLNQTPYEILPNSTLNQALNILPDVNDGLLSYPYICAYCIGMGENETYVGPSGTGRTVPILHKSTDTNVHKLKPLVLREIDNDLTAGQRANYACRRLEVIAGKSYWAYYLGWLADPTTPPTLEYTSVVNGIPTTPTAWIPSAEDLAPVGTVMPNLGVNRTSPDMVRSKVIRDVIWNEFQRTEYLNVANILYNDEREALIGDVGIVAARKRQVQVPATGSGTFMFTEAIMATIMAWVPKIHNAYNDDAFELGFHSSIEEGVYKFSNSAANG